MFGIRAVFAAILLYFGVSLVNVWSLKVPEAYMDEIFHVPQAQAYCHGNWSTWDPKITTPPGLYLTSVAILKALSLFSGVPLPQLCTVRLLRLTNVVYLPLTFLVITGILLAQEHAVRPRQIVFTAAMVLAFFPLNFFFYFMYYTDVGSTFWLLAGWHFALQKRSTLSGVAGFISMWFRQTNVVWMGLHGAYILYANSKHRLPNPNSPLSAENWFALLKALSTRAFFDTPVHALNAIFGLLFIVWNKGVVLGDRSNHLAGLHFPQLFYFTSFTVAWLLPHVTFLDYVRFRALLSSVSRKTAYQLATSLAILVSLFVVQLNTKEHPFILSDNRHYTFYLWKDVYRRSPVVRYLLTPGYLIGAVYLWFKARTANVDKFVLLLWALATAAVLVPSPLLEFRYFVPSFYLFRLFLGNYEKSVLFGEFILYSAVNFFTIYIFLFRPVYTSGSDQATRFLW